MDVRRGVLGCDAAIGDCRQHVVLHDHRRRGVLGDVARVGDHDGDGLSHVTDLVARQRVLRFRRRQRRVGQKQRQPLCPHRIGQIDGGDHRVHARHDQRDLAVDGDDLGVPVRRAHEAGVQQAGQFHVIDKASAPGEQCRIFEPRHARAELLRTHHAVSGLSASRSRRAASSAAATMPA